MALTATIYNFDIDLSDSDRGVYETVALRVAQHPSESDEYLIARVLAYLLEYAEGIVFSRGVSEPEEPMISVRDLTGKITHVDRDRHAGLGAPAQGIEGGGPGRRLLPQGGRAVARRVLPPRASTAPRRSSSTRSIARLIAELVSRLDRRMAFGVSINDRELYVSIGDVNFTGRVERIAVDRFIHGLRGLCGCARRLAPPGRNWSAAG